MPQIYMSTNYGGTTVTDRRFRPVDIAGPPSVANFAATRDMTTMDPALVAANGAYWTTKRLNEESWWDKLFWLRSQETPSGLA